MRKILPALLVALIPGAVTAQTRLDPSTIGRHFEAFRAEGCFVGYDQPADRSVRYGGALCDEAFVPASTFKILNSLIVLETGVVTDEHEVVTWDGVDRGWAEWNRDHDLESAFRYSVVWVYQELARRVGRERMAEWVRRAGYGNGTIGSRVDRFWLDGPLMISPEEQVAFLRRLAGNALPFSPETMEAVRAIMVEREGDGWTIRAKTGWGRPPEGDEVGWKVGWVERRGGRFFFAVLIRPPYGDFPMRRAQREITGGILVELGVLPEPPG